MASDHSARKDVFAEHVVELMNTLGPVTAKRMFGGHGLFLDGLMLGLIADGVLYLKADADSEERFRERGLEPFVYLKQGKPYTMSYFRAPEQSLESPEEMHPWARLGFDAALRADAKKKRKRR